MRKCGFFLIRRLRFSLWSGYLGDQPARIEELQSADETNATFSHKNPSFSSNSTRFLGSKVAIFPYFWALLPEPEITSLDLDFGAAFDPVPITADDEELPPPATNDVPNTGEEY